MEIVGEVLVLGLLGSQQPVSIDRSPESTAGDVEIVGEFVVLSLSVDQLTISIERPSPEALSISPLEAVEEILEEVEDRRTGFWDFRDQPSRLSVCLPGPKPEQVWTPKMLFPFASLAKHSPFHGLDK